MNNEMSNFELSMQHREALLNDWTEDAKRIFGYAKNAEHKCVAEDNLSAVADKLRELAVVIESKLVADDNLPY